jgi:hypothetical protein
LVRLYQRVGADEEIREDVLAEAQSGAAPGAVQYLTVTALGAGNGRRSLSYVVSPRHAGPVQRFTVRRFDAYARILEKFVEVFPAREGHG